MMAPEKTPFPSASGWKLQLRDALRTAADLAREGWIAPAEQPAYEALLKRYPLVLPRYYANLIDRQDPLCPIRLQAIPQLREAEDTPGWVADPLQDLDHRPAPRVTHRYRGRALLHLTPNCSLVCRYCFRKSLLGEDRAEFFEGEVGEALAYLERTQEIEEVIFSGGDPFLANEKTLLDCVAKFGNWDHLRRVRFHSRVPATLPARVTREFGQLLAKSGKPSVVVVHFNHPREVTDEAREALSNLKDAGLTLLNQSVLLSGVNDSEAILTKLFEDLFDAGVLPYYLHHPDRAQGTKHFDLTQDRGAELVRALRKRLPGYLVPRYVQDNPAHPYKLPLA